MLLKFFVGFILFHQIAGQNGPPVTVYTTRGALVGYHVDYGNDTTQTWYGQADVFLGIPFGLPPVGGLRYKPPRPLTWGSDIWNATYYRMACIQPGGSPSDTSEDCLYWNAITPNASSITKYPVMVWIHGGGLIGGSSHVGIEGMVRNLVSKGIVMTSIDYRMGWLGFFTTLTADFPPNLGMLDQVLALKFIKEEISYFGGDSNKITIFGQSAGGHSVSAHTYSPLSQNLFQQVIMESGTVLTCYENSVGPTNQNFGFAQAACNYTKEMWESGNFSALTDCLMNMNVSAGTYFSQRIQGDHGNNVCWNMVQDNYFFPGNPQALWRNRPNIPAMIGNCIAEYYAWEWDNIEHDNGSLTMYTRQQVEERLLNTYSTWFNGTTTQQAKDVLKIWEDNYLKPGAADDDHLAWLQLIVAIGTPAYFSWGDLRDIEYYVTNNNPSVYPYEFVWSSPMNGGRWGGNGWSVLPNYDPAHHGCELGYVAGYGSGGLWNPVEQALANSIQEIWADFAIHGQPKTDGSWKPTTSKNFTALEYFQLSNVSSQKVGYRAVDEIVWNQAIPKVLGDYPPYQAVNYNFCPRGYQSKVKNTTCYEAFNAPLAWNDAQKNCVQNSYGTLVSIDSAFENSDLVGYVKITYPGCTQFFTGLFITRSPPNFNYTWVNYDPSTYRNWKSGSPNQDQNSSCVVVNTGDGTWTNTNCNTPQCYVCSY